MTRSQRGALVLALAGLALAAAHGLDGWAYQALAAPDLAERDWNRLLRVMGFAPTWLVVAALLWLESRGGEPAAAGPLRSTSAAVVLAVAIGGLGSELLKLLIRRARPPGDWGGDGALYSFRSFAEEPFSSDRFGMPSGHTMVAFSGAAALATRFPRAAPVLFALAAGCGLTRLLVQAHFLSDVVAGAIAGTAVGRSLASALGARHSALGGPLSRSGTPGLG
jgi:membrane-associated phospholipid phosphatase